MRVSPRLMRLMLRAFSGNEFKFLMLLLRAPKGAYGRIHLSLGELERRLSLERPTVLATQNKLATKGIIRSKITTDPVRVIPITAYLINEKKLLAYCSLFELHCYHCGTTTATSYVKHHTRPKSRGGKKTFYLCANCHHDHHYAPA